ncbi:hypothetical protein AP20H10_06680 [Apilactobacillus apinorum]|uniref:Uncharacterized protein n=1 Tax=Apilactobacillus apinorum TaxID=1218495 RepID=A0ABP9ZHM8_9LACO
MHHLRNDIKLSYAPFSNLFNNEIKSMSVFGDDTKIPVYAFGLAIISVLTIDLLVIIINNLFYK